MSDDLGSIDNGGDYGWFDENKGFVDPFKNAGLQGTVGNITIVPTQFGFHIIEVLNVSKTRHNSYTVAQITKLIAPSGETSQEYYKTASDFAGKNQTSEAFNKSVDAENIIGIVPVSSGGTGVGSSAGLKTALALNNVNNTSDADKIISTKTQAALDLILVTATDTTRFSKRINAKADTTDLISGLALKLNKADTIKFTKQTYSDSALLTKLSTTGNATTATLAGNITATTNTTLTSLSNLATVGTITSGVWSGTTVAVEKGGTGLISSGTNGQVLTSTGSGTLTWTGTHYIGETYGGGKVFYVYDNGKHGLIAATSDQSTGIRWYGGSNTNTRARGDGVGAGLKNTAIIIANQGAVDGNALAATVCNEYSVTVDGVTYGDWYLPSKHELDLLYLQKTVVGGFAVSVYWSSTERGNNYAWTQDFFSGYQYDYGKASTFDVRAIRAF
jgi:hypothetical protein